MYGPSLQYADSLAATGLPLSSPYLGCYRYLHSHHGCAYLPRQDVREEVPVRTGHEPSALVIVEIFSVRKHSSTISQVSRLTLFND